MSRRRRTLILTLLALAVPLPAYAITNEVLSPTAGPQSISVSASLDSCGVLEDGVVCKIDVSFSEVSGASSYSATVTRADGSVIDYGSLGAGGGSIWVPYVGAGNYSVKVTAYGEPESADDPDGRGAVIATGYSRDAAADGPKGSESGDGDQVETEAGSSAPGSATLNNPDGAASTEAGSSAETPADATTPAPETTTTCTPSTGARRADRARAAARGPRPGESRRGRGRDPRRAGARRLRAAARRVPGRARRTAGGRRRGRRDRLLSGRPSQLRTSARLTTISHMPTATAEQLSSDAAREFIARSPHGLLIGGERPQAADGRTFATVDPATGERDLRGRRRPGPRTSTPRSPRPAARSRDRCARSHLRSAPG